MERVCVFIDGGNFHHLVLKKLSVQELNFAPYDTAILVSSDGDLIPAVDWIRRRRSKKVEYVGFSIEDQEDQSQSTRPLQSMINRSDIQRILVVSDIKPFIRLTTQKALFEKRAL